MSTFKCSRKDIDLKIILGSIEEKVANSIDVTPTLDTGLSQQVDASSAQRTGIPHWKH